MARIDTGESDHRTGATGCLVSCVVAATLAAVPAAQAAVPKTGAWESGSRSEPRVSFDVRGRAPSRTVQRVSFPITCKGRPSASGWGSTDIVQMDGSGRFTAYEADSEIRGRFTAKDRAEVTVRSVGFGTCRDTRRYVVIRRGRRIAVRVGDFRALVGGGAAVGLETDAFGRMVSVDYMDGSIPAGCSDGSQRPLTLAGPAGLVLAAPIRPSGRFDISAAAGSSITISGTFEGGSVGAIVDLSVVLPDGVRCTAPTQPLVGSLAFALESGGESENYPGPPVINEHPG
jgi:hypothetical protein